MNDELTPADIQRLLTGDLQDDEKRDVVRKLIKGCPPEVLAFTEGLKDFLRDKAKKPRLPKPRREMDWHYLHAIGRAYDRVPEIKERLEQERKHLAEGLAAMRACPGGWNAWTDSERHQYQGRVRIEMLWEAAFAARSSDPADMVGKTTVAKNFAEALPEEDYGPAFVADYRARACAELGNALRVTNQLQAAEDEFVEAWVRFAEGSGDAQLKARINSLETSLLRAQRRIPEALALLQETQKIYRKLGDKHLAGRTLVEKGVVLQVEARFDEAVPVFRQALTLLDRERDPELVATTTHSLIFTLADCGDSQEAGRLLLESDLRTAFADQPLNLLKLRWAEGKIYLARGDDERGVQILTEVRKEFSAREQSRRETSPKRPTTPSSCSASTSRPEKPSTSSTRPAGWTWSPKPSSPPCAPSSSASSATRGRGSKCRGEQR